MEAQREERRGAGRRLNEMTSSSPESPYLPSDVSVCGYLSIRASTVELELASVLWTYFLPQGRASLDLQARTAHLRPPFPSFSHHLPFPLFSPPT